MTEQTTTAAAPSNTPMRAAVIGLGTRGRLHCDYYSAHTLLAGVADRRSDRANAAAVEFGVACFFGASAPEDVLRMTNPTIVSLAVPPSAIQGVAIASMLAGKHVLIDALPPKRSKMSVGGREIDMFDVARETERQLLFNFPLRFALGTLLPELEFNKYDCNFTRASFQWLRASNAASPVIPVDAMHTLGVHGFDLVRTIFGRPALESVLGSIHETLGVDAWGAGEGTFTFAGGRRLDVTVGFQTPMATSESIKLVLRSRNMGLVIDLLPADDGRPKLPSLAERRGLVLHPGWIAEPHIYTIRDAQHMVLADFVKVCRGQDKARVSIEDAIASMEAMDMFTQSAKRGQAINLAP